MPLPAEDMLAGVILESIFLPLSHEVLASSWKKVENLELLLGS